MVESAVRVPNGSRLRVTVRRGPYGCPVVEPIGDVDFSSRQQLAEQLALADGIGTPLVFLDLRALSFIDSAGVHVVRRALERIGRGRLLAVRAPAHIQRIVAFLGLEDDLDFIDVLPGE